MSEWPPYCRHDSLSCQVAIVCLLVSCGILSGGMKLSSAQHNLLDLGGFGLQAPRAVSRLRNGDQLWLWGQPGFSSMSASAALWED